MKAILPFLAMTLQAFAADRFPPAKGRADDSVQPVRTVRPGLKLKGNDMLKAEQAIVLWDLRQQSVDITYTIDELNSR